MWIASRPIVYDLDQTPQSRDLIRGFPRLALFRDRRRGARLPPDRQGHGYARAPAGRRDSGRLSRKNIGVEASRRRCSCCWTAAIRTPRPSRRATPKAWCRRIRRRLQDAAFRPQSGQRSGDRRRREVRVWYNPDLVSRQLHRAGTDRGDPDDHRGEARLADHRARMGKRHHGAVALDAGAARRKWRWANCRRISCWASSTC